MEARMAIDTAKASEDHREALLDEELEAFAEDDRMVVVGYAAVVRPRWADA
jgi:hypothetical protein